MKQAVEAPKEEVKEAGDENQPATEGFNNDLVDMAAAVVEE